VAETIDAVLLFLTAQANYNTDKCALDFRVLDITVDARGPYS
jgi:hypothetical protein